MAVAPALLLRMGQPSVELDRDQILLVVRVPVDHLAVDDGAHLMPRSRQAVGALDVTQVPVFQHGMNSAARRGQDIIELGAPAHFLAHGQRRAELFLRGEPLSAGLGYPAADVIEPRGELNQIQHRFLDAGPRWHAVRLPGLLDAV